MHQSLCRVCYRYEIESKSTTTPAERSDHAHLQMGKPAQKGHLSQAGSQRWGAAELRCEPVSVCPQQLAAGTLLLAALLLRVLSAALRDGAYLVLPYSTEQEMRS